MDDYKADLPGTRHFPFTVSGRIIALADAYCAPMPNRQIPELPESDLPQKSHPLRHLSARQEMVRQDRTYLVEGYTDVLSFHQAGINVVASSGTLTVDQIR